MRRCRSCSIAFISSDEIKFEKYWRSSACSCRCSGVRSMNIALPPDRGDEKARPQPGQVFDRGVVPVHRIGDVHAHAAVQVVADLHHRRRLRGDPVAEHVQIVAGVPSFGQSPDHRRRRQIDSPRGDVDLGELRGDGLEGGQWPAELVPVRHVVGRQPQCAGDQAGRVRTRRGQRQLVHPLGRRADQHILFGHRDIGERDHVLVGAVGCRRL